ncbi:hypothetical protein HMN09_00732800 [Mycena chlorophos]|uniref:Uncharacterized protein n=1 Tax=Mycena chlorophos TaxID=658473 RepID=A0A8H6SVC1_MYCCL|nr:hypothetical protein HMN09_00732800 [Mycena chlorophos]
MEQTGYGLELVFCGTATLQETGPVLRDMHLDIEAATTSIGSESSQIGFLQLQILHIPALQQMLRSAEASVYSSPHLPLALLFEPDIEPTKLRNANKAWGDHDFAGDTKVLWIKSFQWTGSASNCPHEQRVGFEAAVLQRLFHLPLSEYPEAQADLNACRILLLNPHSTACLSTEDNLRGIGFRRVGSSSTFGLSRYPTHASRRVRPSKDAPFATQPMLIPQPREGQI